MKANLRKTLATLLISATSVASTASNAGDVNGPGCVNESVNSNATDVYRVIFSADQRAFVSIRGDRDTDLDLEVRDDQGVRVCLANGPTDREICRWAPRFTREYEIRVRNLGDIYNNYRICTN